MYMIRTRSERRAISRQHARAVPVPPRPASHGDVAHAIHAARYQPPLHPGAKQAKHADKVNGRADYWTAFANQQTATIWDGDPHHWSSPYQTRVTDWLTANGIQWGDIPTESVITVTGPWITYTTMPRKDGRIQANKTRTGPVIRTYRAPLLVPFRPVLEETPSA
jgi:hypothetical protein